MTVQKATRRLEVVPPIPQALGTPDSPTTGYPAHDGMAPPSAKAPVIQREAAPAVRFDKAPRPRGVSAALATMHGVPDGFMATNPSRIEGLNDGRVAMAVREQRDPAHLQSGEPAPGPSQVGFYTRNDDGSFTRAHTLFAHPNDWYEDPALIRLNGQLYVSSVHVQWIGKDCHFTTRLHTMNEDGTLGAQIAHGPGNMKDVRIVALADGGTGLLTRPKGEVEGEQFGYGYVGFIRLDNPGELSPHVAMLAKPLLRPQDVVKAIPALKAFGEKVWVGANDAIPNPDGSLTVYAHFGTNGPYGSIRFTVDPDVGPSSIRNVELLAIADDFAGLEGGPVRPGTVFTGGAWRHDKGVTVTCGLNDFKTGLIEIPA